MKDFVFITGNQHKADQLAKWLGLPVNHERIDLEEIQALTVDDVVSAKVRRAYDVIKKPIIVEDVSLTFSVLKSLPGPFIKWFEKPGLPAMCRMLDGFQDRSATADVVYGYYDGNNYETFKGSMRGTIADAPRGNGGFGFDSIFIQDGYTITRAEMDEETYATTSYRQEAIAKLRNFLQNS